MCYKPVNMDGSYFDNSYLKFSLVNGVCKKKHLSYVGYTYKDDSPDKHRHRSAFTTNINEWLNEPVVTISGIMYIEDELEEDELEEDELEEDELEEQCDSDEYTYFPSYRCYKYIKNKQIIQNFCNDIMQCVKKNKYTFENIKQFKEDFVYYIYKLSDLDSLKNAQKNELLRFR